MQKSLEVQELSVRTKFSEQLRQLGFQSENEAFVYIKDQQLK